MKPINCKILLHKIEKYFICYLNSGFFFNKETFYTIILYVQSKAVTDPEPANVKSRRARRLFRFFRQIIFPPT